MLVHSRNSAAWCSLRSAFCRLSAGVLTGLAVAGTAWADPVPNPRVTGPIASGIPNDASNNYPFFATEKAINVKGYIEEEFFIEGQAKSYTTPPGDTATVLNEGNPYQTRIVVRRPFDEKNFNGNVMVEWYNVTAGADGEADWFTSHEHLMDAGYAWVGVSAQRVGVDYLKTWSPVRYSALDVTAGGTITDDSLSYDIFSQAGQAIRNPVGIDPLGGLSRERVVFADGESQSAGRLAIYVNSIMPRGDIAYDAVILHSTTTVIRPDNAVKVMVVNAEYDAAGVTADRVQQDTDFLRIWEVAGTAHYDWDMQMNRLPLQMRDQSASAAQVAQCEVPQHFTRTPFKYVFNKAIDHVANWVRTGAPPPIAPRLAVASYTPSSFGRPVSLVRDAFEIAQGGIRLPDVDVPTALNHGENRLASGVGNCALYGHWIPFSVQTLNQLYDSHREYVNKVAANVRVSIRDGYINKDDGRKLIQQAMESGIGRAKKRGDPYIDFDTDPDFRN